MVLLIFSVLLAAPTFGANNALAQQTADDFIIKLNFAPSAIEASEVSYPAGFVQLIMNRTGDPVLAPRDLEIELTSSNSAIASVPLKIVIPKGSDYARFNVGVTTAAGESEVSALFGNQIVSKTFKVVEAGSQIPDDIKVVINVPTTKMQIGSEMPISVYLESEGTILQAPEDVAIDLDYDRLLLQLSASKMTIKKGEYYALGTIRTLEKSGNAFVKAATANPPSDDVATIEISQTQPASLRVFVFPERIGLDETYVDIFVGLMDVSGSPTVAAQDVKLDLFASSSGVTEIGNVDAVIKKGEFGYYLRQSVFFFANQTVTVGATASGLGVSTDEFEVMGENLGPTHPKADDRELLIYTVENMPSDANAKVVYQLNAIERDCDDLDTPLEEGCPKDTNGDDIVNIDDWHAIDELEDGEPYPIQTSQLFSSGQGNLNVVSGKISAVRIIDSGTMSPGSSFGTATITSGREADAIDISASVENLASGVGSLVITGGLNPVNTMIFSPAGLDTGNGNYRIPFDQEERADLFFVTLDSNGRPSRSENGIQYLVKPINELTEIPPEGSFARMEVTSSQFSLSSSTIKISATPIGINADLALNKESTFNLVFFSGTAGQILFPFESVIGFSKSHAIGTVQLIDQFKKPLLASEDVTVELSSTRAGSLPVSSVTIPRGKSFANFDVVTFGKEETFTITSFADGVHSTSVDIGSALAGLSGSFVNAGTLVTTVPNTITISTDQGASVLWGVPSTLEIVNKEDKATTQDPLTGSYLARLQVVASKPGDYTIDVTLLKDGFKLTRLSGSVTVTPYIAPLQVMIENNEGALLKYKEQAIMTVRVTDANSQPVSGALVTISGAEAIASPTTAMTDSIGIANFAYTPVGASPTTFLTATAEKEGYLPGSAVREFEVVNAPIALPPWVTYAVIGGVMASVGGGAVYFMKKPKGAPVEEGGEIEPVDEGEDDEVEEET